MIRKIFHFIVLGIIYTEIKNCEAKVVMEGNGYNNIVVAIAANVQQDNKTEFLELLKVRQGFVMT